ncbi:hypothetical protein RB594_006773 [Gaeumannomyces avenae]
MSVRLPTGGLQPPGGEDPSAIPLPYAHTLLRSFDSFLTVAVHNILYYRGIYPARTFLSARAFNLPVQQNRHPVVCAWPSPGPPPGAVLERWMFDVSSFPAWPGGAAAMRTFWQDRAAEAARKRRARREAMRSAGMNEPVNWADVNQQLRGALARLAHAGSKLGHLPPGCTFTIAVELRDKAPPPTEHPQPWIPSPPSLQPPTAKRPRNGRDLGGAKTTAVRSVEAGPLLFECWVEEGKAKDCLEEAAVKAQRKPPARGK